MLQVRQQRLDEACEATARELRESAAKDELAYNSEHRLRAENLAFDIDVWYRPLQAHTFDSVFLPLSRWDAAAIVHNYDVSWRRRPVSRLSPDDVAVLRALEARIDAALSCHFPSGAFIRLCGRSPKDGEPLDREDVWRRFQEQVRLLEEEMGEPASGNTRLIAVSRTPTLKVNSGAEALSLLLSSERVYFDVVDWLKHGEPEQIVLRKWEEGVSIENEFRAFVCENRLTAISQYDHYCKYPHLPALRDRVESLIRAAWGAAHKDVGIASYCCDWCYLPASDSVVLVELSPFLPCTGPALFSWIEDAEVLKGNSPFEFRISEKERPQIDDLLDMTWVPRWKEEVPRFDWCWGQAITVGSQESLSGFMLSAMNTLRATLFASDSRELLFVYGTLKKGFHWHQKFLTFPIADFIGPAVTERALPLVVGDCGVPYLLGDLPDGNGECVRGEVWQVATCALKGMDEYEGCSKGYYHRQQISVSVTGRGRMCVWVYFKTKSSDALKTQKFLPEYTVEMHRDAYRPVQHILVKQQAYLQYSASTWGLAHLSPAYDDAQS